MGLGFLERYYLGTTIYQRRFFGLTTPDLSGLVGNGRVTIRGRGTIYIYKTRRLTHTLFTICGTGTVTIYGFGGGITLLYNGGDFVIGVLHGNRTTFLTRYDLASTNYHTTLFGGTYEGSFATTSALTGTLRRLRYFTMSQRSYFKTNKRLGRVGL